MDKITTNNEFFRKFPDEKTARKYLEYRRWKNRITCPHCDKSKTSRMKDSECYQCNMCREKFTVRTGAMFERSHIPLNKWLYTMWLFAIDRKRASSSQLSKEIGITQKSAWLMLRRLREVCGDNEKRLFSDLDVDETHIGGKENNKDDSGVDGMNTDLYMEVLDKVADKVFQRKIMKAVKDGEVILGNVRVNCAVLNDEQETTVFTLRTLESVVGIRQRGGETVADLLPLFMRQSNIKKYREKYLSLTNFPLIPFTLKRGGKALGITVEQTDKVMQGWIDAGRDEILTKSQKNVAYRMQMMKDAASVSGFTQVIHEQLGYVDIRKKTITELFDRIFEKKYHRWARQFIVDYYEHIYRLKGKEDEWKSLLEAAGPRGMPITPSWLGNVTNDIIYSRLQPPGILEVLQKKNPVISATGLRARKHHQHLTKDDGIKRLDMHLGRVIMLMQLHTKWEEFREQLDKFYPAHGGQRRLDFVD